MKTKVRFGIIGSGFVSLTHAEALSNIESAELVAIAGGRNAGGLAQQYGVRVESTVERLIEADDIDAVVVCSPHLTHAEQTISCANAGKHVLVEKPMAVTAAECTAMIEAAEGAGRQLMVAHFQRYREPNAAAKRAISSGAIGTVLLAQQRLLEQPNNKAWQLDARSRGFFLGYGIHGIDLLRWWIGSDIDRVMGFTARLRGNPTEDAAQALFHFAGGATASVLATDCLPEATGKKAPGAVGLTSLLIGDKGTLEIDSYGETVLNAGGERSVLGRLPSWSRVTSPERILGYKKQDEAFVDCILRDAPPEIPGSEGMRNVIAALALYESSETGLPVQLTAGLEEP